MNILRDSISVLPLDRQDGLNTAEDCAEALSDYVVCLEQQLEKERANHKKTKNDLNHVAVKCTKYSVFANKLISHTEGSDRIALITELEAIND